MTQSSPSLESLADTLWVERHVVEHLLFMLVTAKLLLAADERRFVGNALKEVDRAVNALREAEVLRAGAVEEVARQLGVAANELTLDELARRVPEPMRSVFRDHKEAFGAMTSEIEETASTNRQLASSGLVRIRQALDALTGLEDSPTYDAAGRAQVAQAPPVRLDQAL